MNSLDSIFKVIIVHEDPLTGQQAADVLQRLAQRLENEFAIEANLWETAGNTWRFEGLRQPDQLERAVASAVAADMIIISARRLAELPGHVRDWLESALSRKQGEPAALVALLDQPQGTRTATSRPDDYLRQLAARCGVDFFCNTDHAPKHAGAGIDTVLSRYEDDSAFLPEELYRGGSHRGWGIND